MKIKHLVHKKTREFAEIIMFDDSDDYKFYTSDRPTDIINPDITFEEYEKYVKSRYSNIDLSDYEIREFDVIETGEIGADIRNKLSPLANLIALLEVYFKEDNADKQKNLLKYIKAEIKQGKKVIKYLSDLL